MNRYGVKLSPVAEGHAETIQSWWTEHRPYARALFADELDAALSRLADRPSLGAAYLVGDVQGIRRILLPRTRYHVYFSVDDGSRVVRVHAIWHSARGVGPPL